MTDACRALCGMAGAALLLYAVHMNYVSYNPPCGGGICVLLCPWPEPFSTVASYLMSFCGFYLFGEGILGGRLRSRRLVFCLVVFALALASVLVAGLHSYWVVFPPAHEFCIDD